MPITLFDVQSQQPIEFESGSQAKDAILSGQANFDPNQEVYLKDSEGNISKAMGKDAPSFIISPGSNYSIASDEDIFLKNREARYGTPLQQGVSAVEGAINSAGLGLGNALTKVVVGLATPFDKKNKIADEYGKTVAQRSAENESANMAGEVAGLLVDPLGAGALVSKGTKTLGKGVAKATGAGAMLAAEKSLAPKIVAKVLNAPIVQKMTERGAEFGAEGAIYGSGFEAGRQLVDGNPINSDSIIDEGKSGALFGLATGPLFGATEHAAAKSLKFAKEQTKKYVDKLTGATGEAKGEIFHSIAPTALEKEINPKHGRNQKSIKLTEEADGTLTYKDQRKSGVLDFPENAIGLDLTDPKSVEALGEKVGIKNLEDKVKYLKSADEPLAEFIAREKNAQILENEVRGVRPYMETADMEAYDRIRQVREGFKNLAEVTPDDIEIFKRAVQQEEKLFNKYNPEYASIPGELKGKLYKKDLDQVKRALSEFDYIKDLGTEGKKEVFLYNEGILPRNITVKNLGKGIKNIDFEAGQMAKQYRMTPAKMQKMGNARLNEVADFIFDQYPKQGSILKKATTSIDHIAEQINEVKNRAINDLNDTIEQALNTGGARQVLTSEDIARYVDETLLKKYTDPVSGNPLAGMEKAYQQVQDFADGYRNNGFVMDGRYGIKKYKPLDVKEIRKLRIDLDGVANFGKKEGSILEEEARKLRSWVEDEVVSRVGAIDKDLLEKYKKAKKDYGLSVDAEKIVNGAALKASKDSKFSLFYSGMGAGAGGAIAGAPGAIAGGLLGGAANNIMKEYSGNLAVFMGRDLAKNAQKYQNSISSAAKAFFKPVEPAYRTYVRMKKDNEADIAKKDLDRLTIELGDREKFIEDFMDKNEFLFEQYPETGERLIQTAIKARDFLITKAPVNPYIGNPWKENSWTPSPYEVDKYMRYREAVNKPSLILNQIKNSYVTPEAVEVLNDVYPETKQALLSQFLEQASKAKFIPVAKRVEIYKIFGIELDSFMSGDSFMELQGASNQQALQSEEGGGFKPQNAMKTEGAELTLGQKTAQ
jgi:hypothetical protein